LCGIFFDFFDHKIVLHHLIAKQLNDEEQLKNVRYCQCYAYKKTKQQRTFLANND